MSKSFPGVKALDNVSFEIRRGEIVGLIGENGAGKSTLLKILNGVYQADVGQVIINGNPVAIRSPREAFDSGIAMVFQEQSIFPTLSVADNIFLGREQEFMRYGLVSTRAKKVAAVNELKKVNLSIDPGKLCAKLSFAERQMVEFAKALSLDDRIDGDVTILLDEPTSVLERKEVELLFSIIRELTERASIVFISHRLEEVLDICDRIYVMRDGKMVAELRAAEANIKDLHRHMVGRQLQHEYYREARQTIAIDDVVLESAKLCVEGEFSEVSFKLRKGEVLGIAGVIGSGREALIRCLAGHVAPTSGSLKIAGKEVTQCGPKDAVKNGIGLVPAERKTEGLVAPFSISENMTLPALNRFQKNGILLIRREHKTAAAWIKQLSIRTPSIKTMAGILSGGNQQKVVLAKWRVADVDVLILDHPTRGIDVGAKEDVYELVRDMTEAGLAIILLGDTLDEVVGVSSRILIMKDGRVITEFDAPAGAKPSQVDIVSHMV